MNKKPKHKLSDINYENSTGNCSVCGITKIRIRSTYKRCYNAINAEERAREKKRKLAVIKHYSQGKMECAQCKYSDIRALSIDHIMNDGAEHRKELFGTSRGTAKFNFWLIKNGFPPGFQILCFNCQWIKHIEHMKFKEGCVVCE